MSLSTTTAPKSPSPLRAHFNTLPTRSPTSRLQVPHRPTPISRLGNGIPRSHSTSSLHDLVTDLRHQQQYQQKIDEQEVKKRSEESSKNTISRHASIVVRYYHKAKRRSPSLTRALSSATSPKKNIKGVPQSPPPAPPKNITKKPAVSQQIGSSSVSSTEPRLQRADSQVRVQQALAPLVKPSAAVIEEIVPQQVLVIEKNKPAEKTEQPEAENEQSEKVQNSKNNGDKNSDDERNIKNSTEEKEKIQLDGEEDVEENHAHNYHDNNEDLQPNITTHLTVEPQRQRMPARSLSSPPTNSTSSWYAMRFDETDVWLQNCNQYHQNGELDHATLEFQRAANANSPIGLFLFGLSLRHGWGCKRSERRAFQYLQKSAEHAIFDIQQFVSGRGSKLIANRELIMSIYELGQAYSHGWGCHKDKKTAAYYFKMAADLGDADAQNETGRCYQEGRGVKKNMKIAAKYYRKADQQGHGMMGNSWIYKEKYCAQSSIPSPSSSTSAAAS